jgi:ribosomal protein S27AE
MAFTLRTYALYLNLARKFYKIEEFAMSDHDIADCPKCGKRDYILKDDKVWICLNCGHTDKMPKSRFDSDSNPSTFSVVLTMVIIALLIMVAIKGGELSISPRQDVNQDQR